MRDDTVKAESSHPNCCLSQKHEVLVGWRTIHEPGADDVARLKETDLAQQPTREQATGLRKQTSRQTHPLANPFATVNNVKPCWPHVAKIRLSLGVVKSQRFSFTCRRAGQRASLFGPACNSQLTRCFVGQRFRSGLTSGSR